MRRIKVLEFSNQWSMGGTEKTAQLLLKHLNKDRFEVYAAGWKGGPRLPIIEKLAAGVLISEDPREMSTWIKSRGIDIAHFHRMGTPDEKLIHAFTDAGVPVLVEHNIFAYFDNTPDRDRIHQHIFISKAQLEIYKQRAGDSFEPSKCISIYYPVETETFDGYDFTRDFSKPVFGRFSRDDPKKWHPINIQVLPFIKEAVPDARFHVIGLPDTYREAIGQLHCLDMVSEFPLTMDENELCGFLNGITVFTHGAVIGESFGASIAEAMASGLPVVTHSGGDGAQAELVTDQYNGFVVDPRHIRSYAARVIQLLKDPLLKKQMGDRGRARVKEWFSVGGIVRQIEEVFTGLYSGYST